MSSLSQGDQQILDEADAFVRGRVEPSEPLVDLPTAWQVFLAVSTHIELIKTGALPFFFDADFPGSPDYTVFSKAYRSIGFHDMACWIDQAVVLFPFDLPHLQAAARRAYMSEHCTEGKGELCELGYQMMDAGDLAYRYLAEFVRSNAGEFYGPTRRSSQSE
jgi:hypothetical protein